MKTIAAVSPAPIYARRKRVKADQVGFAAGATAWGFFKSIQLFLEQAKLSNPGTWATMSVRYGADLSDGKEHYFLSACQGGYKLTRFNKKFDRETGKSDIQPQDVITVTDRELKYEVGPRCEHQLWAGEAPELYHALRVKLMLLYAQIQDQAQKWR